MARDRQKGALTGAGVGGGIGGALGAGAGALGAGLSERHGKDMAKVAGKVGGKGALVGIAGGLGVGAAIGRKKKVEKSMGSYCINHGLFDGCAEIVKAFSKDDGIHHLTGTSRVRRSQEGRGTMGLVPLEVGRRKLDGTPMMGHAEGAASISENDKCGSAPAGKRTVAKADSSDPFEVGVSKAFKDTNYGKKAKPGQRGDGRAAAGTGLGFAHSAVAGKKGKKLAAAGSSMGHSFAGNVAGAQVGGALGSAGGTVGRGVGSVVGGYAGGYGGNYAAYRSNSAKGRYKKLPKSKQNGA